MKETYAAKGEYLIGTDIGTSSTKTVITDKYGRIISSNTEAYGVMYPKNGWAEQWPDVWMRAAVSSIKKSFLASGLDASAIRGICISGLYGGSGIPLDKDMNPVRPCIIWMDRRTDKMAQQLMKDTDIAHLMQVSENGIDSYFGFTKIMWIRDNEPELWKKIKLFLTPNQYVIYQLTGEICIDRTSAGNLGGIFDFDRNTWSEEMCEHFGIPVSMMPQKIVNPYDVVGTLTKEAARMLSLKEGIPVCAGCVDCLASNLSSSTIEEDQCVAILGTSLNWGVLHTKKPDNPKYISMPYVTDNHNLRYTYGGITTAGALTKWFFETFSATVHHSQSEGMSFTEAEEAAASVPVGSEGLIMLPYFMGERCPIWDSKARGTLMGLSIKHTSGHIYRAILESVGYALRHVMEDYGYLQESRKTPCILVGGGSSCKLWVRILADITGVPMKCMEEGTEAPLGDAFIAGYGTGLFDSFSEIETWMQSYTVICPDWQNHERYNQYYEIYKSMYSSLMKDMHALTDLGELPQIYNS